MKTKSTIYTVFLIGLLSSILFCGCPPPPDPTPTAPIVTIASVTNITANTATSGGEVTDDGGATVTARGVCWSTNQNPTTSDHKTSDGSGKGSFTSSVTELTPGATYFLRAYATNAVETAYSIQSSFPTLALVPILTTTEISGATSASANSGGNISNDGGSPIIARGVCWSTSQNPTIADSKTSNGTGTGNFTSSITGLTPGVTYYIRAYATNSIGTAYGGQITAATTAALPSISTITVSDITTTTATSGGNITNDGGSAVSARGVCWSTSQNPTTANSKSTDGTGTGNFTSSITGLTAGSIYYVRAYATNSGGTAYGNQVTFTTSSGGVTGSVTDIDGNVYHTVTIGTQTWMAENLRTTKYNDGTAIPLVTGATAWYVLKTPGMCTYNNTTNADTINTYGRLYNWYTVSTGKLAPTGWHVPTDAEWTTLTLFLGSGSVAGGKLKEIGTTHWQSPNTGATNVTGFTALPGGRRTGFDGHFIVIGGFGFWWSSSEHSSPGDSWSRYMGCNIGDVPRINTAKSYGYSVRCLRD